MEKMMFWTSKAHGLRYVALRYFNACGAHPSGAIGEVVDVARKITGHPIPAEIAPRRAGDPAQLVASSEKAKTVLGWNPQYAGLETIVASAWNWHKSHPHGFEEG